MAGYVIHLAVAEAYKSKHPDDIENYDDFIQGIIFPDSVYDKSITHYGEKSSKVNLREFLIHFCFIFYSLSLICDMCHSQQISKKIFIFHLGEVRGNIL